MIESILIDGAIAGGIYSLLALGFTLIYGVSGVINLAHSGFFMIGALLFATSGAFLLPVLEPLGVIPTFILILALILAAISVATIGGIVYKLIISPIIGDDVAIMVVTVSLALIFQQIMLLALDAAKLTYIPVAPFIRGATWGVRNESLLAFGVSVTLFISLWIFITKSKIGGAMRAVSQDREVAMLMGINTERLYMLTMGISAAFATVAGVFYASSVLVGQAPPHMWLQPLFSSFAIVILGGLGSIKGTLIGGFIIAYTETLVAYLIPQGGQIVPAVSLVIIMLIILIRPKGLFGKRIEME